MGTVTHDQRLTYGSNKVLYRLHVTPLIDLIGLLNLKCRFKCAVGWVAVADTQVGYVVPESYGLRVA